MPPKVLLLTLVCTLVFAAREARATTRPEDLKRAEAVIEKLRRLEEAAGEPRALRKAASKLYPSLFSSVSKLNDSGLKTDLSTAVSLYDSAARGEGGAHDCSRELRDSYARLCRENAPATRAGLLAARARLHTRWAEAELRYARGERDAATLETVSLIRAERATDLALAEEALLSLGELNHANDSHDADDADDANDSHDATTARGLEQTGRILASLPRNQLYTLLRNARDATRDALYWRLKSHASTPLVVNINSYSAPDARLRPLDSRADEAERAALANRRAARRFIRLAGEAIEATKRVAGFNF
jgi:hypothetical protein